MKRLLHLGLIVITTLLVVVSCDQFQTKKIPSSQYLAEQWKAIDFSELEVYPTFDNCNTVAEGAALKACFEETVTRTFYESFGQHTIVVNRDLDETILVDFVVNEKGKYCIDSLKISTEISAEIPQLEQWIHEAAKQLPQAKAARKNGVPVKARFKIPVVLKVE